MGRGIIILLILLVAGCTSNGSDEQRNGEEADGAGTRGMMRGDDMPEEGMMADGGMMQDSMPAWMMSNPQGMMGGMMAGMMEDMRVIHALLVQHEKIERHVENIPGGVRTTTTSEDPEVAEAIRTHVHQMKERMETGNRIRQMDPVFRELFDHREQIDLEYEEIPGGVRVTETSSDPRVVALIRQHAHAFVSEVVEHGMPRAMQPTPLPEGYER